MLPFRRVCLSIEPLLNLSYSVGPILTETVTEVNKIVVISPRKAACHLSDGLRIGLSGRNNHLRGLEGAAEL